MSYLIKNDIKLKNCIIIYDLETTDLNVHCAKIIDRFFYDYSNDLILSNGFIK